MAIQAKITTIQGVTLEQAYINLASPQISKVKTETGNEYTISANACVYASKDAYDAGKVPVEGFSVSCDLNIESNALSQLYAQLTLSDRLENIAEV